MLTPQIACRVLLVGLLLWSLATAATGLMPNRAGLIASRVAMGKQLMAHAKPCKPPLLHAWFGRAVDGRVLHVFSMIRS